MDVTTRFSEIVDNLHEFSYHILGCGAIGSSTAIQLARMGAEDFYLYDFDRVEIQNVGVSQYIIKDIGKNKVDALRNHIVEINDRATVYAINNRFKAFNPKGEKDIVILAFDSMDSRKEAAVATLKTSKQKPFLFIDGRMGAEHYQQYTFFKPTLQQYLRTWYSDEDGTPEPCSAKATSYCSNMSGSFIVNQIRKAVTDGHIDKEFYFNFPSLDLAKKL